MPTPLTSNELILRSGIVLAPIFGGAFLGWLLDSKLVALGLAWTASVVSMALSRTGPFPEVEEKLEQFFSSWLVVLAMSALLTWISVSSYMANDANTFGDFVRVGANGFMLTIPFALIYERITRSGEKAE